MGGIIMKNETNELNGFELQSYETIRFATGGNARRLTGNHENTHTIREKNLLRWLTHDEMWKFIVENSAILYGEKELEDENFYLYIFVMTCFVYKKSKMRIKKSKYRKIKKLSRQQKEEVFDFLDYENERVFIISGNRQKISEYILELVMDSSKSSIFKKYMSEKIAKELEVQIAIAKL